MTSMRFKAVARSLPIVSRSTLLFIVLGLAASSQAGAASLSASASVTLSGTSDTAPFSIPCTDSHTGGAAPLSAVCDSTHNFVSGGNPQFTQGKSEASATYGVLQATSGVSSSSFSGDAVGTASASFHDEITVAGTTSAAEIHLIFLESHLGSASLDQVMEFVNGVQCPPGSCTTALGLGIPILIRGNVLTGAFTPGETGLNSAAVSLFQIELLDSMGNPIDATGVNYTTGSGMSYNFPGATFVPEPGGLMLMAVSLLILLWMRFRPHGAHVKEKQ